MISFSLRRFGKLRCASRRGGGATFRATVSSYRYEESASGIEVVTRAWRRSTTSVCLKLLRLQADSGRLHTSSDLMRGLLRCLGARKRAGDIPVSVVFGIVTQIQKKNECNRAKEFNDALSFGRSYCSSLMAAARGNSQFLAFSLTCYLSY